MALPVPDDALAAILRRMPPRSLAAVRCVCKQWCNLVDDRALLRPLILPHSVHGVVITYVDHHRPHLFSRPSSAAAAAAASDGGMIDGSSLCLPRAVSNWHVMDHCDGLLLCGSWDSELSVCNPATRRRATLPAHTYDATAIPVGKYLVFDPAASPHYEVFLIPTVPEHPGPPPTPPVHLKLKAMAAPLCLDELLASLHRASYSTMEEMMEEMAEPTVDSPPSSPSSSSMYDQELYCLMCWHVEGQYLSMEWPPSPYKIDVFSSRTGRWEERVFVREGETVTTLKDMKPWNYVFAGPWQGCSVFWQGALYVHSGGACVTRFSLSNDKYQVIRAPINILNKEFDKPYLGKSKMGVSFGFIHDWQLSIWILKESAGQMEWVLTYQHDLQAVANQLDSIDFHSDQINGPWIVEEGDADMPLNTETLSHKGFEWDSDNDDFLAIEVGGRKNGEHNCAPFGILGFHPYKEVIYLEEAFKTVAYHLNSSKIQFLGYSRPKCYGQYSTNGIYGSFVYTPCMIGDL